MTVTLEVSKLSELLFEAAQTGAKRALEQTGMVSNTITLAEVKKQHGRDIAKAARLCVKIKWMPVASGGRTSGVYCLRASFERFLFERKFDFNK